MGNYSQKNVIDYDLSRLADNWHAPVVGRNDVDLRYFSGGSLPMARTMANLDSRGEGPPRFRIGKRVVYPVDTLIKWMKQRQYQEPNGHLGEDGKWGKGSELEEQYGTFCQPVSCISTLSKNKGENE